MFRLYYILILGFIPLLSFAQGVINDGGLIVVGSGANVIVGAGGNYLNQSNGMNHGRIDLDGNIYLGGNWTNNASSGNVFVNIEGTPDGMVYLNGSTQQNLSGTVSTYFENLTINNSSVGNSVLISLSQNIKGNLIFTDGIMGTGANQIIIENADPSAVSGHASDKYINGNLRRYMSSGSFDFPVGTLAYYELITTNITTLGSLQYADAYFNAASPGAVPGSLSIDGTLITSFLDYGYWTLAPDDGSSTTMDVTVVSRGHTNGASQASQHALFKRTGAGNWESFGTHSNTTQSGTLTNPITAKRTAYNNVLSNDYAIGRSDNNVLPIDLLYFNAQCGNDSGIIINWATASESNNDFFTIYRSNDKNQWVEVARVSGAGNSNIINLYQYVDEKALLHDTYYKLRQTDYNGEYEEFPIVITYCKYNHKDIRLYPIPAREYITFDFYNEHQIIDFLYFNVYNSSGILCFSTCRMGVANQNSNKIQIDNNLPSGNYFLQVRLGSEFFYTGQFNIVR